MTYNPRGVVSYGFTLDQFTFTYLLSGSPTAANLGHALTFDNGAASTMKLAGDGDAVHGRLSTFEDRTSQGAGKTGAVERKFKDTLPSTGSIAVGDAVCGSSTPGTVRKAIPGVISANVSTGVITSTSADPITNRVVEVLTGFVVVEAL